MIISILKNKFVIMVICMIVGCIGTYIFIPTKEVTKIVTQEDQTKIKRISELESQVIELQTTIKNTKIKERIVTVNNVDGSSCQIIDRESEEMLETIIELEAKLKSSEQLYLDQIRELTDKLTEIQNKKTNNIFVGYDNEHSITGLYQFAVLRNLTIGPMVRYNPKQDNLKEESLKEGNLYFGVGLGLNH